MADIRIKDLATTATTTASDDFMAVDGATNGTRKLSAATPAFLTSVTTPSITSPAATNLTLGTGTSGAAITVLSASNNVGIGTVSPAANLQIATVDTTTKPAISLRTLSAPTFGVDIDMEQNSVGYIGFYGVRAGVRTLGLVQSWSAAHNGNVGIGTTTPAYRLSLLANTATTVGTKTAIEIKSSDGLSDPAGQTLVAAEIDSATPGDRGTALTFSTGRQGVGITEKLKIASSGTVSIASTTAGSSGAGALVVPGGLATGAASYFGGAVTQGLIAGAQTVFTQNGTSGWGALTKYQSSSVDKWLVGMGAQTGSNDFEIYSYVANNRTVFSSTTGAATFAGTVSPQQATTAGAPAYVKGAIYFDTTLNKLRVGGATAYETITSV